MNLNPSAPNHDPGGIHPGARQVDPIRLVDAIDTLLASAAKGQPAAASGAMSPFELKSLLHRCLDDGVFCSMVLHKFAVRSADQIAALERALVSGNAAELAERAHGLKAVAANLSAERLRHLADTLERNARGGDLEQARALLALTREEIARCVEAVPKLLARIAARRRRPRST